MDDKNSKDESSIGNSETITIPISSLEAYQNEVSEQSEKLAEQSEKISNLHGMVEKDEVTGVLNRKGYKTTLTKKLSEYYRHKKSFSVVVMDIDYFKKINDEHGHLFGDKVLEGMAKHIKNNIREMDVLTRYAGDEFVMFMPVTRTGEAYTLAERLRYIIDHTEFNIGNHKIYPKISLGVAEVREEDLEVKDGLFYRADKALYRAKEAGRNKTALEIPLKQPSEKPLDVLVK